MIARTLTRGISRGISRGIAQRTVDRPFDGLGGQLFAASFFCRVLSTWTGACLVARRSSDNAEDEFGFTPSGALDTAALLSFAGSGSAYLVRHYDQTGQSHDVVQATTANQMRLVNAGVLDTNAAGRPIAAASGTQRMTVTNALGFARNASAVTIAVLANINTATNSYVFGASTPGGAARATMLSLSTGVINMGGRRLDANGAQAVEQAYAGGFARLIGRLRYSEALADMTVNGVTASGAFQTAGVSSDTDSSTAPSVFSYFDGNFRPTGQYGGIVLARAALPIGTVDTALRRAASA